MSIKTKSENKKNFEAGDKPTEQNFSDLIDSYEDNLGIPSSDRYILISNQDGTREWIEKSPDGLYIHFTHPLVYDSSGGNLHFEVRFDTDPEFSSEIVRSTQTNVNGWWFFNGSSYQPFPSSGLPELFYLNKEFASVIYIHDEVLSETQFIKGRSFNGLDYSTFRTSYGRGSILLNPSADVGDGFIRRSHDNNEDSNINNVGTFRYRETVNSSTLEVSMKVGEDNYQWVVIASSSW